jgi:hypothetical protein
MTKRESKQVVGWNVRYCECGCNTHVAVPVTRADRRRGELATLSTRIFDGAEPPRLRTLRDLNATRSA